MNRLIAVLCMLALPAVAVAQSKPKVLTGPKGTVWALAFSADGKLLAAASDVSELKRDDTGKDITHLKGSEVRVWDVAKGEEKKLFSHNMQFGGLAFSPDGKLLAAGTFKDIQLFDVESGAVKQTLKGFEGSAKQLAFSADGKTLYSATSWFGKAEVRLWNVQDGKLVKTLTDPGKVEITGLAVSKDGKTMVTSARITEGGFSGQIKVWDLPSGTVRHTIDEPKNWINNIALSPDGKMVAAPVQFTLNVWDTQTGKLQKAIKEFVSDLEYLPSGTLVGTMNSQGGSDVSFIDARAGKKKQTVKVQHKGLAHFAFSPDGKWLACGSGDTGTGQVQVVDISKIK